MSRLVQQRANELADMVGVTGSAFLGLTVDSLMLVVFLLGALPPMARTTAREEVERFTCRLQDRQTARELCCPG